MDVFAIDAIRKLAKMFLSSPSSRDLALRNGVPPQLLEVPLLAALPLSSDLMDPLFFLFW